MEDFFGEIRRMQREMDEHFERLFKGMPSKQLVPKGGERAPAVDLIEKKDSIVAIVELPGVKKDDIDLNVTEKSFSVSAKSEVELKKEKEGYFHQERSFSSFSRTMPLPAAVIPEDTRATFKNGILEVTMRKAKPELAKHKKIAIE